MISVCLTTTDLRLRSYYHGLKALAHPQQAQTGFSRGSFEAYQHKLADPAKQRVETLPWLLHGLDQLEEHRRHSMRVSVSATEPGDGGLPTHNRVQFSLCIEQWRITEKIVGYQGMCALLFCLQLPSFVLQGSRAFHVRAKINCDNYSD